MKIESLFLSFLAISTASFAPEAYADFSCKSLDGETLLKLQEPNPKFTRAYTVGVKNGDQESTFDALPVLISESVLFSKYQYKLSNVDSADAILTIASSGSGGCGRGGCNPNSFRKSISGKLNLSGVETDLSCEETNI